MRGRATGETHYLYDEQGRHVKTVVIAPDLSATDSELYSHDARRQKTRFLRNPGSNVHYSIEGTSMAVGSAGARAVSTTCDHHNLPSEVCFLDVDDKPIQRVMLQRDEAGRLLNQAITMIGPSPWPGLHLAGHQEEAEAAIRQIFADAFTSTSYTYDDRGRLIEGEGRIRTLGGDRTTFRYEDREEAVEETTEHTARQVSLDEDGTLRYSPSASHVQHNRFDYVYDSHGNWTSRTISIDSRPRLLFGSRISSGARLSTTQLKRTLSLKKWGILGLFDIDSKVLSALRFPRLDRRQLPQRRDGLFSHQRFRAVAAG
jgi:YD repeat-containing protein